MADTLKVGPWGALGGESCDINSNSNPQRLVSIKIWSLKTINGFGFTYVDQHGKTIEVGICGSSHGTFKHIKINQGEHVNRISGTTNKMGLSSLKLGTDQNEYGPYGDPDGPEFSLPLRQGKSEVVAFFGYYRYGATLEALGVYVRPRKTKSLVKVGPWIGHGGSPRDLFTSNMPRRLQHVTIHGCERSGGRIYGFSYAYIDKKGQYMDVGQWGSTTKGQKREFTMNDDNYINFISGTHDEYGITSLKFVDSNEEVHGPYGCEAGHAFSIPLPENVAAIGFFGHCGTDSLVGFGAYIALQDD